MGNRSIPSDLRGVPATTVRLPGVLVRAQICVPTAHPYAVWLLPWVEALLTGETLATLQAAPPWPAPADPLVTRTLLHTLIELRWVVPDWGASGLHVDPDLAETFRRHGRAGLARVLFAARLLTGEWWADALGGVVLPRQTAAQFDWDLRRVAEHVVESSSDPRELLARHPPDLGELIRKLGGVEDLWVARDRAFLASPFEVGERKDILFTMVGDAPRLLPPELAELEPVLEEHAPDLFGPKRSSRSRVVKLRESPVEPLAAVLERLDADPVALGPLAPVVDGVTSFLELVERSADALAAWLDAGLTARPVVGPTQPHFDALREMCSGMNEGEHDFILVTTAFLSNDNAAETDGLADVLATAPVDARVIVVYGHANDDLPVQQDDDMRAWAAAVHGRAPTLARRLTIVAGARRSHEKVVVTSGGDWLVGSWNAGSSRPGALVFEASMAGRSPALALALVDRIAGNVDEPAAAELIVRLRARLTAAEPPPRVGAAAVTLLRRAAQALSASIPAQDGSRSEAWAAALVAARAALHPFMAVVHGELIDEQQTRDTFLAHVLSARHDVLVASDRLATSALDAATLRDLRGDGRCRRTLRLVWGREWAGRRAHDPSVHEQLERARRTVREARELVGPSLLTEDAPMENHAKLLVVDGLRGLVTSENLLSYGGEKGRYESRELGVAFWSPVVARHILGRMVLQWQGSLAGAALDGTALPPLDWIVAGNEAWHALAGVADQLDFEWDAPGFIGNVVRDELARASAGEEAIAPTPPAWDRLVARAGTHPYTWVQREGARLGLVDGGPHGWRPHDAIPSASAAGLVAEAERAVAVLPEMRPSRHGAPTGRPRVAVDALVERVMATMVEVPAGSFLMGDDRVAEERPRHRVTISRAFLLGRTPVTQGLWEVVMGGLPHLRDTERHPDFPIIHVSHAEMRQFIGRLNALHGGGGFALPTEAQWEYACRAGSDRIYCFGDDPGPGDRPGQLEQFAWTKRSGAARLQAVGQLAPNAFGLHDMHGLVYETMHDGFRRYTQAAATDPVGPLDGARIVARGGFWGRFPVDPQRRQNEHFRCASRQVHEKSHRVSVRIARHEVA